MFPRTADRTALREDVIATMKGNSPPGIGKPPTNWTSKVLAEIEEDTWKGCLRECGLQATTSSSSTGDRSADTWIDDLHEQRRKNAQQRLMEKGCNGKKASGTLSISGNKKTNGEDQQKLANPVSEEVHAVEGTKASKEAKINNTEEAGEQDPMSFSDS